jgi:hypothetical protein
MIEASSFVFGVRWMSSDSLQLIQEALKAGDKKTAQMLLRPLIKAEPTAEVWYLSALACGTDEKAIYCLRQALELEAQHSGAKRMLLKLEGVQPNAAVELSIEEQPSLDMLAPDVPLKKVKRTKRKRSTSRTILLLSLLILGVSISTFTMNMAGLITGPITAITELTGGATPVREINGKPLSQVEDAPLLVAPAQTKPLTHQDADVLEPGYAHEYTFAANNGQDVAIYVQFLSIAANHVSRNVVVLRPDDSDATSKCERDAILQGDNNVTFTCAIDANGIWKVRILGRDKESVGAYFVGVQNMS